MREIAREWVACEHVSVCFWFDHVGRVGLLDPMKSQQGYNEGQERNDHMTGVGLLCWYSVDDSVSVLYLGFRV